MRRSLLPALAAATAREQALQAELIRYHRDLADENVARLVVEAQFAQREQALHQLVAQWEESDRQNRGSQTTDPVMAGITLSAAETYRRCASALAALLPVPEPDQEPQP